MYAKMFAGISLRLYRMRLHIIYTYSMLRSRKVRSPILDHRWHLLLRNLCNIQYESHITNTEKDDYLFAKIKKDLIQEDFIVISRLSLTLKNNPLQYPKLQEVFHNILPKTGAYSERFPPNNFYILNLIKKQFNAGITPEGDPLPLSIFNEIQHKPWLTYFKAIEIFFQYHTLDLQKVLYIFTYFVEDNVSYMHLTPEDFFTPFARNNKAMSNKSFSNLLKALFRFIPHMYIL